MRLMQAWRKALEKVGVEMGTWSEICLEEMMVGTPRRRRERVLPPGSWDSVSNNREV